MIQKLIFFQIVLLAVGITSAQQKPFTITGTIKGRADGYIYLSYKSPAIDSALIKNGKFSFSGTLDGPVQAVVMMDRGSRSFDKYAAIYIVPAKMQMAVDYNNFNDGVVLKGSSVQDEGNILKKIEAPAMAKLKPMRVAYDKKNDAYMQASKANKDEGTVQKLKDEANVAKDAMEPYIKEIVDAENAFMDKYPKSYVTASTMRYRMSSMSLSEAETRYDHLPDQIKNSSLGIELKNGVDGLRMGSPGAKAYVFASKELRGQPLSLSDYRGKYVLLDFWASWCVPCRKGNPHLLSLYSRYKDKGFEIIGISDDDGKPEAWQKAVDKDGIGVWKHILRGLKWDGNIPDRSTDISDNYGIHSLPTKILIDPNGNIIGRYGGGGENDEAMDKKLSEIFGG